MRWRFFAIDEHFHFTLLGTNDHGLLAHPPLLLQGLHVGSRHPLSQRLNRFAFAVQQQTLDIQRAVASALRAPHVPQKFRQKLFQPIRAGLHLSGIHISEAYMRRLEVSSST